jgi:hypothetical protein
MLYLCTVCSISSFKSREMNLTVNGNECGLRGNLVNSMDVVKCRYIEFHVDLNIGGGLNWAGYP